VLSRNNRARFIHRWECAIGKFSQASVPRAEREFRRERFRGTEKFLRHFRIKKFNRMKFNEIYRNIIYPYIIIHFISVFNVLFMKKHITRDLNQIRINLRTQELTRIKS